VEKEFAVNRKMRDMMAQAQKMQSGMVRAQEELAAATVEGTSGGGMVTAVVNGQGELKGIRISPDAVDPSDVEMLEDLVLSAVQDAVGKSRELAREKMQGLGIPSGLGDLF
jgi:hypothetical protein